MSDTIEITEALARKVLETVDAGLVSGIGEPIPVAFPDRNAGGIAMALSTQLREAAMLLAVMVLAFPPIFIAADWLRYS